MKQSRGWIVIAAALGTLAAAPAKSLRDYLVQPVPFTAVHLADTFWLPRIEINRRVTIPLDPTRRTRAERRYRCCYRWQADYRRIRGSHAAGTFSLRLLSRGEEKANVEERVARESRGRT
jgi:hypothetical protein